MKNRPILFSAPMVRALLDGSKTQTRRCVKNAPDDWSPIDSMAFVQEVTNHKGELIAGDAAYGAGNEDGSDWVKCPHGQPGDGLLVRETYFAWGRWETRYSPKKKRDEWHFVDMTVESGRPYLYAADGLEGGGPKQAKRRGGIEPMYWKRPAIFMPRDVSRITLEITGVRVERLQDISAADAIAEGIEPTMPNPGHWNWRDYLAEGLQTHAVLSYKTLWESINGLGSWDLNPWVWALSFKRVMNKD